MTHRSICSVPARSLALCLSSLSPGDAIMGEHAKLSGGVFVSA